MLATGHYARIEQLPDGRYTLKKAVDTTKDQSYVLAWLTQEQLGDYVGVTKQTVSGWEHGKRTPDSGMLAEICRALDCSADYIIGLSDTPSGHFAGHA